MTSSSTVFKRQEKSGAPHRLRRLRTYQPWVIGMPILKNLPTRLKAGRRVSVEAELGSTCGEVILHNMSLNPNPFEKQASEPGWQPGRHDSLLEGGVPHDRNPFDDEEDENEANEVRHGGSGKASIKGTLDRIRGASPLKTLGKLGKGLRVSVKTKGSATPSPQGSIGNPSPVERKKKGRRSSEGSLLRIAGRCRESLRKESLPSGDLSCDSDADQSSRRLSFLKLVGRNKHKRESGVDQSSSQGPEEGPVEEFLEVKAREPLSVLEILQLVTKRDLFLADTHILELEQECADLAASTVISPSAGGTVPEDMASPGSKDSGRRKAKDVELLYEALKKEMWEVVRQALHVPTAGPNLGLVVQVLQQEERADSTWANGEKAAIEGPRPRQMKNQWREAVAEAADGCLPQAGEVQWGEMFIYLDKIKTCMLEDLKAAWLNVVPVYPKEYDAFQVYVQSYHQAVSRRLQSIVDSQLHIKDIYSLLDWIYNIYNRDVLGIVSTMTTISHWKLAALLPSEATDKLELDCLNSVRGKVTNELSRLLDEEEKSWKECLSSEDCKISLADTVTQMLQEDLDRSAAISKDLGARVSQCSLNGLADFLYSFQRKVEMFLEPLVWEFGEDGNGYISTIIALVNCCPSFRKFVQQCQLCESAASADSAHRANASLDRVVNLGVRLLSDRLFENIRPFFDKLVKRKWLNNPSVFEPIETSIREHFRGFSRMASPPYQLLVGDVHRQVMVEYLRALMRGRIICTSQKMRHKMAGRLHDEGKQLKMVFEDLESPSSWLDNAIPHLSEIILLEDTPSIQMEVGILVREFPDMRKKHVSAMLNIRGMTRHMERQEILNIVKDIEMCESLAQLPRDHALFSEVPVTSEVRCLNMAFSRIALATSSCFSSLRVQRKRPFPREPQDDML
ncbi:tumor necrosis factor alpha-induced protein 2 isoform X2 [Alosa sapidissima]|uniref:tumor necrosis factor alpha-induced protein 2 isoform X2 n=1 Tax=Alosa sapidissima TaxID=34773 RepID=UPI001C092776|nr:tumor necrosis factor alpha-induced protein 2 isoform X2 [Alosa sapidissima]